MASVLCSFEPDHLSRRARNLCLRRQGAKIRVQAEAPPISYLPFTVKPAGGRNLPGSAALSQAGQPRDDAVAPDRDAPPVPIELRGVRRLTELLPTQLRGEKR